MPNITDKTQTHFFKVRVATAVAIIFHLIGLTGLLFFKREWFVNTSAVNLLLMFFLILYTQQQKNTGFYLLMVISFLVGMGVEWTGTSTGLLFGNYSYGTVLGPSFRNVPWIIGLNWFMVIYCCGVCMHMMLGKLLTADEEENKNKRNLLRIISIIIDGATIAVALDWLMEPVAVQLGYWKWAGEIPVFNYACWFLVSVLLLGVFHICRFNKENKFAVHLLLIQAMFFLLLRTFL